jgi:hypothetical protein
MNQIPPELFLMLQQDDTDRHLVDQHRYRLAEARRKVDADRRELERARQLLLRAIEAESRSRAELSALTR